MIQNAGVYNQFCYKVAQETAKYCPKSLKIPQILLKNAILKYRGGVFTETPFCKHLPGHQKRALGRPTEGNKWSKILACIINSATKFWKSPRGQNPYRCIADLAKAETCPCWRNANFHSDPNFTRASPGFRWYNNSLKLAMMVAMIMMMIMFATTGQRRW